MAQVMDTYGYTPAEVAALTPAQLERLCFHPRDEHGGLRRPGVPRKRGRAAPMPPVAPPADRAEALARLAAYCRAAGRSEAEVKAALEAQRARWSKSDG